jgi:hypothetical protein
MNEEIQNKTTDKGWTAMRELLDQEMPTEPKRRRFLWWWLAILLIPIAAEAWHAWSVYSSNPSKLEQPNLSPNPAPVPMAKSSTPENTLSNAGNASPAVAPQQPKLVPTYPAPGLTEKPARKTSRPNTEEAVYKISSSPVENPRIEQVKPPNDLFEITPSLQIVTASEISNGLPNIALEPSLNHLPTPEKDVVRQAETQSQKPFTVTAALPKKAAVIRPRTNPVLALGGTVAVSTERFNALNSIGGGIAAQWQPTHRWGIRSGLQFTQYSSSNGSQPIAIVQSGQYEQAVDSSYSVTDEFGNVATPTTGSPALQASVIIPVTKLQALELPVLISWQAIPRVKIFAGVNTTFIMATKTGSNSFSGDLTLKANTESAFQRLNTLAASDIPRWRFGLQTGVGVSLSKQIEVGILAKFPLQSSNTVSDNRLAAYDSNSIDGLKRRIPSFSLSATYFFQKKR